MEILQNQTPGDGSTMSALVRTPLGRGDHSDKPSIKGQPDVVLQYPIGFDMLLPSRVLGYG